MSNPDNNARDDLYRVGQRIICDDFRGTIQYIGPVSASSTDVWYGIDWDDRKRGKHNGTYNGVNYFKTRYSTSGSFVKKEKLSLGYSCPSAIKMRYGEVKGDETAGIDRRNLNLLKKEMKAPLLEVVGFDKVNKIQSQFDELRVVWLHGYEVNGPGNPYELKELAPKISDLDISRTLLKDWKDLSAICEQLECLSVLNISDNLIPVPDNPEEYKNAFKYLEHIVMGYLNYDWISILKCIQMFPQITTLQVPHNNIDKLVSPPDNILYNLTSLSLEENPILDWNEINHLGNIKTLESFFLSNSKISKIFFPDCDFTEKTKLFSNLKVLHVSQNLISEWKSFDELNKLQNLIDLRCKENPVCDIENIETTRQLILVRISNLRLLNGVVIEQEERKGAEYDFLRRYGKDWLKAKKCPELMKQFQESYPCYEALVKKYGAYDHEELEASANLLKKRLISVKIYAPDHEDYPQFNKKLPESMLVQKLGGLIHKLYKTGDQIPKLSYFNSKSPDIEIPLNNDFKSLSFYSVEEGDCILVRW